VRVERGDQVLIAAISGPTPKIVIIRFRLWARTVRTEMSLQKAFAADFGNPSPGKKWEEDSGCAATGRNYTSQLYKVVPILVVIASVMHSPMPMQKVP